MSFFELDAPHSLKTTGLFSKVATWSGKAIRSMQYGRMVQALASLSDAQLDAMGIVRSDIPRYARECLEVKDV